MEGYRDLVIFDSAAAGAKRDEVREILADFLPGGTFRGVVPGEKIQSDIERAVISGYDRLVVAGGDDLVAQVAQAMLYSGLPLGIVPLGSKTLLAQQLGVPLDPEPACELLSEGGAVREVSVMTVNRRVALLPVRIGATRSAALGLGRTWSVRLRIDGATFRTRASLLAVEHVRSLSSSASTLSLSLYRRRNLGDAVRAVGRALLLRPPFLTPLESYEVRRDLFIDSASPLPIEGVPAIGAGARFEIENLSGALRVITAGAANVAAAKPARPPVA